MLREGSETSGRFEEEMSCDVMSGENAVEASTLTPFVDDESPIMEVDCSSEMRVVMSRWSSHMWATSSNGIARDVYGMGAGGGCTVLEDEEAEVDACMAPWDGGGGGHEFEAGKEEVNWPDVNWAKSVSTCIRRLFKECRSLKVHEIEC